MENASKALLIAGAILLVIAIIAIAVGIVSQTRGTIDAAGNQISSMEIQIHNEQFEQYEGIGKTIEETRELLITIAVSNQKAKSDKFIIKNDNIKYTEKGPSNNQNDFSYTSTTYFGGGNNPVTIYNHSIFKDQTKSKLFNIKFEYNSEGIISGVMLCRHYNKK